VKSRIVHIVSNEKFISSFVELVNDNFDASEHIFLNTSNFKREDFPLPKTGNVIEFKQDLNLIKNFYLLWNTITPYLIKADKIIVHGAFTGNFNKYLFFNPKILAKCYWVMWGGDLYQPIMKPAQNWKQKLHYFFDNYVKGRFTGYVTYLPKDYELAQELYNAKGKYIECIMYPSNLYQEVYLPLVENTDCTVLVGNSGDPTNNHKEVFSKLNNLDNKSFNVICPLSYGNKAYIEEVKELGNSLFGSRFKPLTKFVELQEYLTILATTDIALFAHKRQQGMGNIISLLGLGKKVYLKKDLSPFKLFENLNIKVFDIEYLNLSHLPQKEKQFNQSRVEDYFSKSNLIKQLNLIFEN
jgi:dTDP-N-acetylfucosamine:lipid II N-acetylfucosaminyltransferase